MVIKAADLKAFGFYWMRTNFEDGSFTVELVEYRFDMLARIGDDRYIFSTEFEKLCDHEFFGPIKPPDEMLQTE